MYRLLIILTIVSIFSCKQNQEKGKIIFKQDDINLKWATSRLEKEMAAYKGSLPDVQINVKSSDAEDEEYALKISDEEIIISGNDPNGAIYVILELSEQLN